MRTLADHLSVALCTNLSAYPISVDLDSRIRVYNLGLVRSISPLKDLLVLIKVIWIFRMNRFDAVHSITPKAGLIAMLAAAICQITYRHHTFTGQVWADKRGIFRALLKAMDRLIVALSTGIFADSRSQCEFLVSEGVVYKEAISVIGNGSIAGVDLDRFCLNIEARKRVRHELGTDDNSLVYLFVGRLAAAKGLIDLVRAYEKVTREIKKTELWLVGPDEEALWKVLTNLCSIPSDSLRWFGETTEPERFMSAADILVLPSYREGFGSVIIEAAACGIPTVGSNIYGITDAVIDGKTGCLVTKGDVQELAESMIKVGIDPLLRQRLSITARQRASEEFSSVAITNAWLAFYREILCRPG